MNVAILDDYQRVAPALGPWEDLGDDAAVTAFDDHVADDDALVERLPNLRLLVTTGRANASIDMDAARELGIIVAGTDSLTSPTAELTWALILAVCRNVCAEDRAIREGACDAHACGHYEGACPVSRAADRYRAPV